MFGYCELEWRLAVPMGLKSDYNGLSICIFISYQSPVTSQIRRWSVILIQILLWPWSSIKFQAPFRWWLHDLQSTSTVICLHNLLELVWHPSNRHNRMVIQSKKVPIGEIWFAESLLPELTMFIEIFKVSLSLSEVK